MNQKSLDIAGPEKLFLKKPVVLVGLMGAGKTSVGMRLANMLGLSPVDSDAEMKNEFERYDAGLVELIRAHRSTLVFEGPLG